MPTIVRSPGQDIDGDITPVFFFIVSLLQRGAYEILSSYINAEAMGANDHTRIAALRIVLF